MECNLSSSGTAIRATTAESYRRAIKRVILAMQEQLDQPLSLGDLAEIAFISPYHFDRIFRQMTGIPPCQFLGALRIQEAKRLLLTTRLRVTDICFEVGYNSLGTFITRFTQLVGLTPRSLRCRAQGADVTLLGSLRNYMNNSPTPDVDEGGVKGMVSAPDDFAGMIFVGLFPTPIPQSKPVGCTVLTAQGSYHIHPVRDGVYYVLAAGFPWPEGSVAHLLTDSDGLYVGASTSPVTVTDGQVGHNMDIMLRPLQLMDPPVLIIPPLMLSLWLEGVQLPLDQTFKSIQTAAAG